MSELDQYHRTNSEQRPLNDNERAFILNSKYVKGAFQAFASVADLVAFHPNKMERGMSISIADYPTAGSLSDYYLTVDPSTLLDATGNTIVTVANFTKYWALKELKSATNQRVFNYAPNKTGGGKPTYPYNASAEVTDKWSTVFDASKGHRWVRWRTDDVDDNSDGVFDNWSIPLSIGESYSAGDYIENRFKRQDVDLTVLSSETGLQADLFYIVLSGSVLVNDVDFTAGKTFQHEAGNTYTFTSATVQETIEVPASSANDGTLNNEPVGWTDTPPVGSQMLWAIEAQKSVYGQLKTDWRLKRIIENPNYVRYSNKPTPLPSTICATSDSAATGTAKDTDLIDAGWKSTYTDESYIAIREDDNGGSAGPPFTEWTIEKINEESGEYTDYVFKLYDSNLDPDSVLIVKPTLSNPEKEGFFDIPQVETSTKINYVFTVRKFFNGELKTEWSNGIPWTAISIYNADIISDHDDNFKYDADLEEVDPAQITLTAQLFKGLTKLWEKEDVTLTFAWDRIYDDGSVTTVAATTDDEEDFYMLPEDTDDGEYGEAGYIWDNQKLVVKPDAVTGKAIFRATITLSMESADDIVFEADYSIIDITDGKDAKVLTATADSFFTIYDDTTPAFVPDTITLRAYESNLVSPVFKWFVWTGSAWSQITTGGAYVVSSDVVIITVSGIFAADNTAESKRYAVTTHASDPDLADNITTFSDFITISKISAAGVGTPGVNSVAVLLDNESSTLILDSSTNQPIANETGASGRVITNLQLWDGATKKVYSSDYSVAVSPTTGDIQFAVVANGNDAKIYITSWTSTTARTSVGTITITYGALSFTKKFQVSTSLDAPGALVLDIDSDKGFQFSPSDRADKTLTANLYDSNKDPELQTTGYEYRFRVANSWGSWSTTRTKTITRANVKTTEKVTVEVRITGETTAIRSRTINITDIVDAATIRMVTDSDPVTNSNKLPATKIDATSATVSGVTWKSINDSYWDTNSPVFACEGSEDPSDITKFIWSNPYRIKGEAGSQGPNGDFFLKLYKQNGTTIPSDTASLATMTGDGWVSSQQRPAVDNLYEVERRWNGEGVTFDANGYPDTTPSTGSKWSSPNQITGAPGTPGDPGDSGNQGEKGWAPKLSAVTDGSRRVLQLVDWVGGAGTKPGNVGEYIGSSGFVSNIASAVDVRGATGAAGADGTNGIVQAWSTYGTSIYGISGTSYPSMGSIFGIDHWIEVDLGYTPSSSHTFIIMASVQINGGSGASSGNSQYAIFTSSSSGTSAQGYLRARWYKDNENHGPLDTHMTIKCTNMQRYVKLFVDRDGGLEQNLQNWSITVFRLL